jgi:hypothetical protein
MKMTHATGTGDSLENTGSAATGSRRRVAFWVAGATLTLFLCGSSAPSPLYAIYQAKLGFSAAVATELTLGASERGTSPDTATGDAHGRSTQPEERTNRRSRRRIVSCRFSKRKAQPARNIDPITNGPWHLQYS